MINFRRFYLILALFFLWPSLVRADLVKNYESCLSEHEQYLDSFIEIAVDFHENEAAINEIQYSVYLEKLSKFDLTCSNDLIGLYDECSGEMYRPQDVFFDVETEVGRAKMFIDSSLEQYYDLNFFLKIFYGGKRKVEKFSKYYYEDVIELSNKLKSLRDEFSCVAVDERSNRK